MPYYWKEVDLPDINNLQTVVVCAQTLSQCYTVRKESNLQCTSRTISWMLYHVATSQYHILVSWEMLMIHVV